MTRPDLERGFPPSKLLLLFPTDLDEDEFVHVSVLARKAERAGLAPMEWEPSPDPENPELRLPYVRVRWTPNYNQVTEARVQAHRLGLPATIDGEPLVRRDTDEEVVDPPDRPLERLPNGLVVVDRRSWWGVMRRLRRKAFTETDRDRRTGWDLWWRLSPLGLEEAARQRAYAANRAARLAP